MANSVQIRDDKSNRELDLVEASGKDCIPVTNPDGTVIGSAAPAGTQDVNLIEAGGVAIAGGAAVIAASLPVNIASDQTVPISAASLPLPAGAATETSLATVAGAVAGTEMQVDVLTSALPSGASTSANQTTGNASLATLAGAVAGTEMQVDVLTSALPAGAATETSLATVAGAVAGTEMQVDVLTSALPSGAATSANQQTDALTDTELRATAVPISAASLPLPAGASTAANQTTGNTSLSTIAGAVAGTEMQVDVLTLPALIAGAALVGDVGLSGARTSGGTTPYKNIDVDQTEDAVKASAGQVYWIHCINLSATTLFLKFYDDTVATVIVGTTIPTHTFPIPTQGDTNGAGFTLSIPNGIEFGTAITVAATTGVADADAGAPGVNEVILNLGFA